MRHAGLADASKSLSVDVLPLYLYSSLETLNVSPISSRTRNRNSKSVPNFLSTSTIKPEDDDKSQKVTKKTKKQKTTKKQKMT